VDPNVLQQMIDAGLVDDRAGVLAQQMKRAQGLMAAPGAQGMNVGGTYVAASPLEHLASAMSRIIGGQRAKGIEQQMGDLIGQKGAGRMAYANAGEAPAPMAPQGQVPPLLARPPEAPPAWSSPSFEPQSPATPVPALGARRLSLGEGAALSGDPAIMAAGKARAGAEAQAQEAGFKERELGLTGRGLDLRATAQADENKYRQGVLGETGRHNRREEEIAAERTRVAAEGARIEAEAKAKGMSAKAASDLREEFLKNQTVKNTQLVAETFRKIQGTSETGPGDMSLIFAYMKMLDPGSTVREGEYATAQQAGSVPQNIIAAYNRAIGGEKLAPDVRKQFRDEAKRVVGAQLSRYEDTAKPYRRLAELQGINPEDVVIDMGLGGMLGEPAAVAAGAAPAAAPRKVATIEEAMALPPGTRFIDPNGTERVR
jgi:hypothetical protein